MLPSLPHVDAVFGQGGDDYGDAQAFDQYGARYKGHMPVIEEGGSSNFIRWWAGEESRQRPQHDLDEHDARDRWRRFTGLPPGTQDIVQGSV